MKKMIGIFILTWCVSAVFIQRISIAEERGDWAVTFWSAVVATAVTLILT